MLVNSSINAPKHLFNISLDEYIECVLLILNIEIQVSRAIRKKWDADQGVLLQDTLRLKSLLKGLQRGILHEN